MSLSPVIYNHGWPQSFTAETTLATNMANDPSGPGEPEFGSILNALVASGRAVYFPFTGSNWGHPTVTSPSVGGTAQTAFDDVAQQAALDGFGSPRVSLFSVSMGGCDGLNWAWRNPTKIDKAYFLCPLVDFGSTWDTALAQPGELNIQGSMTSVWGGANKTAFLANAASGNPNANWSYLTNLAHRIKVVHFYEDEVVPFTMAEAFWSAVGVEVEAHHGSHFFLSTWATWSSYSVPTWFNSN
jgi:pimeloyl-ACP methyl ester carboxylesterase